MANSTTDVAASSLKRGQAYVLFAAALEYPEGHLSELVREGRIAERLKELLGEVYPQLVKDVDWAPLQDAGEADDLSIEYTRLFNLPGASGGPACPLNSRVYGGEAALTQLEELVRFYNFFGLTSGDTPANELPDHLTTQFEFLHFLCYQEARDAAENFEDYRRAQRDFLEHHPGKWVPQLNARLKENNAHPYYLALGELLDRFIQLERQYVGELADCATVH